MNISKLERPILAVDVVLFSIRHQKLHVLLYNRNKEPFSGARALPGVAVRIDETLESAGRRALSEKTAAVSAGEVFLEQLAAFDALYRDPRGRTVSVAYMGIFRWDGEANPGMEWKSVFEILPGSLPFDHEAIIETAVNRLRGKLKYTNIAKAFLPETFRIESLQAVYEAILQCTLNRTNFRNKLLKIELIEQVSVLSDAVGKRGGRPPHLYRFVQESIQVVDRDFL